MDEATAEYIAECEEILQRVSSAFADVEKGASLSKFIDAIYRDFHTLKGSSQLFGFKEIGQIAHVLEAACGPIRTHNLKLGSHLTDEVFKSMSLIDRMLKVLKGGAKSLEQFASDVNLILPALVEAATGEFGLDFITINDTHWGEVVTPDSDRKFDSNKKESIPLSNAKNAKVEVKAEPIQNQPTQNQPTQNQPTQNQPTPNQLMQNQSMQNQVNQDKQNRKENPEKVDHKGESHPVHDATIRVHVDLLDRLMILAGELVLVRNQMIQHRIRNEDPEFLSLSKNLDLVTSDLQTEVMKTRMQPIGSVVNKFQRVVRDLGKELGKQIDLTIQGAETELDKTLVEAIKDPLTHIIRNSCDHGIETVADRKLVGKPVHGHLMIRSFHEGGLVVIEISDDGKGLDAEKLKAKAVEKGLISASHSSRMSERDAFNLIFAPGFSTAQQVSAVSGRGVGMDVVRTNIEKIGGSVELASRLGKGTTIKLKIPLTLAIVPALTVMSGDEKYAIPQVKLVELVRVTEAQGGIEFVQGKATFRLRGSILPLVYLQDSLGGQLPSHQFDVEKGINIIVLNAEGEKFGLVVDEILETTDIVVKPLSPFLKGLSTFSGATIMGDGEISLILDVAGIAEQAHLAVRSNKKLENFEEVRQNAVATVGGEYLEFLLLRLHSNSTHAIPLCLVNRLEEFPFEKIEYSGDKKVVQYRGSILPLIFINEHLQYVSKLDRKSASGSELPQTLSVVVINRSGKSYGLVVDEVLDVSQIEGQIDDGIRDRSGILGNLVFRDKIVVVLDALGIIEEFTTQSDLGQGAGAFRGQRPRASKLAIDEVYSRAKSLRNEKLRILIAEDVAFFRKQITKVLTRLGCEVLVAENGQEALHLLEDERNSISLVLSDIEMPVMNGLELARAIRNQEKFKSLPLIALTTRVTDTDIKNGLQAGFNIYLEKLNEDRLIAGLESLLHIHFTGENTAVSDQEAVNGTK